MNEPHYLGETDHRFVERPDHYYSGHGMPPTVRVLQWRKAIPNEHQHHPLSHSHQFVDSLLPHAHIPNLIWSSWEDVRTEPETVEQTRADAYSR